MKTKLPFFIVALICFSVMAATAQSNAKPPRNFANILISSSGVTNPNNAVDGNRSNYALLRADIGILNSANIKVGFSTPGSGGQRVQVEIQNDNGLITADVLQSISVVVYNSKNKMIAQRNGFDVVDAHIIEGTSHYKLDVQTKSTALDIGSVNITISGLLSLENRVRLYNVWTVTNCPVSRGDKLHAYQNVTAPENAISADGNDFALLTPPLLAGNSYLDIAFSQPGTAGRTVRFNLGEGNTLVDATLLQHLTLTVYNLKGAEVFKKSGFQLADVELLSSGRFQITVSTPGGSYKIGRARVSFGGFANVLTTLKVYGITTPLDCPSSLTAEDATERKPIASSVDLLVSPNPFHAYTTLQIKSKLNGLTYVSISDATGKIIEQHQVFNTTSLRLLENAPAGVYFIRIKSINLVETRKVVKM